jgi:BolA protein
MSAEKPAGAVQPGPVHAAMERKLRDAFAPDRLIIIDESHRHEGHSGARPGGESHFRVEIVASAFAGVARAKRHRRVHRVLASELEGGVHALALRTLAPGES